MTELYVQFGCGLSAPGSWLNFDASPTLLLQRVPVLGHLFRRPPHPVFPSAVRYGDIVRGLPVEASSCAAIYCSHVLEHLALTDLRIALRNTYRYLRPGGIFRLVVPDMEAAIRNYLASTDSQALARFLDDTRLGWRERPRGLANRARQWIGNTQHLWMWDYKGLAAELAAAGFTEIRRASLGDSAVGAFTLVEEPNRWDDALGIETKKP